jgi:hypothetical protein
MKTLSITVTVAVFACLITVSFNTARAASLAETLKGKILLQVESHGEAWYVDPVSLQRFYLKDGDAAYAGLRKFGLGIKDVDLNKIPVGVEERFEDTDTDMDGLANKLEEGLKTDPTKEDTDGDGVSDGEEVLLNGTNPLGEGRPSIDANLVNKLRGRIVLQIESRGEAWYINPADGRRYYMKDGSASYAIMRFLSLGITNVNLDSVAISPDSPNTNSISAISSNSITQETNTATEQQPLTTSIQTQQSTIPMIESWEEIEIRDFVYADQRGWTALISTNALGEKRYYRKEGTLWVRKNTEVEIQQLYIEPPTSNQLSNLRLFCSSNVTISTTCQSPDFLSGYNNILSFRKAIDALVVQGLAILTENQRQQVAQREMVYKCTLEPTPPEESMLSPQQQTYLREQRCGTTTPSSELNFKLYQQQEYQECLMNNLSSSLPVSCEYLKPVFY